MARRAGSGYRAPVHSLNERIGLGILLRVLAMVTSAVLAATVKWCSEQGVPLFEIVFFRSFFAFVPLLIYLSRTTGFGIIKTQRPWGHLTRAAIGLTGLVGTFAAVSRLPLVEATALSFTAPLFMTGLSALVLKEKVGVHRWSAVAVGFVGVLIMIHPDPSHMAGIGTLFALGAALGTSGAMIAVRQISDTEPGPRIVFYFTLAGTVAGLVGVLLFGWVTPPPLVLAGLVSCGLIGGVSQMLLTEALRRAPVAVIAPFDYSQIVWASLIGYFVWNQAPRAATLAGAAVVAASGLYILYREMSRARVAAR